MLITECLSSSRLSHQEESIYKATTDITIDILTGSSNSANIPIKYKEDR